MKKILACLLSLVFVLSLFAGCGKSGGNPDPSSGASVSDITSIKTIGEALTLLDDEYPQSATYEKFYVLVFEKDGAYWRLTAALNDEQSAALSDLDILDENYDEQQKQLISPLTVTNCENLSEKILSDEEMNALVGKTGEDLLNDGWTTGYGYNLDDMEFYLEYPPFSYTVVFEAVEKLENTDDCDVTEAIRPLKVKSVTFSGLGNSATDILED